MSSITDLVMSNRMYKLIKSTAVTNSIHALVELITNSNDAYSSFADDYKKHIDITVNYKSREIKVVDQALGVSSDNMVRFFGQVGEYTASSLARGYFSRGAKDITAIGDATFVSIKDGLLNSLILYTNDTYITNKIDVPVTDKDRDTYGITANGLNVTLKIKPTVVFIINTDRINYIHTYYSLRDIFKNVNTHINVTIVDVNGTETHNKRLIYTDPEVYEKPLIDLELKIEGYPAIAKFTVYKLKNPSPFDTRYESTNYGILIADNNAIHERTTFYSILESHPMVTHVIGRLTCPYISELMHLYDTKPEDVSNPFPVIDHSRLHGLNRSHPFTKNLLRHPFKMLQFVLQDLYDKSLSDISMSGSITHIFNNVELFGSHFFTKMLTNVYGYKSTTSKTAYEGYLIKNKSNITSSVEGSSQYDFKRNFYKVDPPIGNIDIVAPKFTIHFTDKSNDEFPYMIYRIGNTIHLDINISDYLISKCIVRKDGKVSFTDAKTGNAILIDLICEALAREVIKERESAGLSTAKSSEEMFTAMEKIRSIIVPQVYQLVHSNSLTFAP
jgi:hypothetical protein